MKKIYLSGPDIFEKDSVEICKRFINLCRKYNFEVLSLVDTKINFNQPKQAIANDLYKENKRLINECDIVLANLNSFRGNECHTGTVWACGYASSLNKKIYGYLFRGTTYLQQFKDDEILGTKKGFTDLNGRPIEDFDYPTHHLLSCSVDELIIGNIEDALKHISAI